MKVITWVNELLFGPLCDMGCGKRVYPKDTKWHRENYCTKVKKDAE